MYFISGSTKLLGPTDEQSINIFFMRSKAYVEIFIYYGKTVGAWK